jgi:hypothetical protein
MWATVQNTSPPNYVVAGQNGFRRRKGNSKRRRAGSAQTWCSVEDEGAVGGRVPDGRAALERELAVEPIVVSVGVGEEVE